MSKNNKYSEKAIIVSGLPRTATTALGDILSLIDGYNMVYEPFNASQGISEVNLNYLIPGANINHSDFDEIFNSILNLNAKFKLGVKDHDSALKKAVKTLFGNESSFSFLKSKFSINKKKLIIKDPFLVFASLYLSDNYRVIMCERPILPLAGSFKRMGWEFSEYDRLINDLNRIDVKIEEKIENNFVSPSVLGAVQFFQLYSNFKNKIERKENIYFFNQNDFSLNPEQSINRLFDWLGEECTDKIVSKVKNLNFGQKDDIKEPRKQVQHDLVYNKSFSNKYYKSVLNKEEIDFVRECSGGEI
ncbi:MAG: sulfotransferase domain-containing protein [Candidatus Neomarinimicrobiota bacterium]|nr:sulfotransferase domain-containing protein [Candidatus Neomarinimicrobiota bacterium]